MMFESPLASTVSVAEFLQSPSLSNDNLFLREESIKKSEIETTSRSGADDGNDELLARDDGRSSKPPRIIILENATRVALLITRAFADTCQLLNDGNAAAVSANGYLSTLTLGDFFVTTVLEGATSSLGQDNKGRDRLILLGIVVKNVGQEKRITTPSSPDFSMHNDEHKQVLGKLLYSVYTRGQQVPPNLFVSPPASPAPSHHKHELIHIEIDEEDDRSSKVMRTAESSVFSRLVESNSLPVPLCRFLSDLIDIGPCGRADAPFASFGDVLRDLGQMVDKPDIFLHDSRNSEESHSTLQPIFGQRYFGQEEKISKLMEIAAGIKRAGHGDSKASKALQACFVSGIAGSGKSHLLQAVADYLSKTGWVVIQAKFERGLEHTSRRIVSSLFDELIKYLVKMKECTSPSDVAYSERASKFIMNEIGEDCLSSLADFLPSLPLLLDRLRGAKRESGEMKAQDSKWQLIYCLTKILEGVLGSSDDRLLMICCDDLQWANTRTLAFMSEFLINIGSIDKIRRRCLFVGSYRDGDAVGGSHPVAVQRALLQSSNFVNVAGTKLSNLSKEDIVAMVMTELRLPRRLVLDLAEEILKKTSGHAYFIVEMLNSLVRDGTIAYSPQKRRYTWDDVVISMLRMGDNVAGLIASNLSHLPPDSQRILQILSCFGTQTDAGLLSILEGFQAGVLSSIDGFIEKGILDRAGPIVIFNHDLILQEAQALMPIQKSLHLQLGEYLGSAERAAQHGMQRLQLDDQAFFAGRTMTSSLISLSCDQVNSAGPESVSNDEKRRQYAQWNLAAGQNCSAQSNFQTALHYYSNGIAFLGNNHWKSATHLCIQLHEGGVLAAFALGETDSVTQFADTMIDRVSFEETLEVQRVVLRSLSQAGLHEQCISKGIKILSKLDFNIELFPTKESILNAVARTHGIANQYSLEQINKLCEADVDKSSHSIVKIMDAFFVSCYTSSGSPSLPLIACAIVEFSLHHGLCVESATAFAYLATFKIFLENDFTGGRHYASLARAIVRKHQTRDESRILRVENRAGILLYHTVDVWFQPPQEISRNLLMYHEDAMKSFQIDVAMFSLRQSWRFKLLGGANLSHIFQSADERLKLIAKHRKYSAISAALDNFLLAHLMGKSDWNCFSVFEGSIQNMDDLEKEARSSKDKLFLLTVYLYKMMIAYWQGEYDVAEKASHAAVEMNPTAIMPSIYLICHTFFSGLIAFHQYRKIGGENRLQVGKAMLDDFERWALNCPAVFENRMLLLKAEHLLSINEKDLAERCYIRSTDVSRDRGNIHELALGYEMLGRYYSSQVSPTYSTHCFRQSYIYYMQWGATAVASRILRENPGLDVQSAANDLQEVGNKRQWD